MSDKSRDKFLSDIESAGKQPKWVGSFREKYYKTARLPFLVIYQATAIASSKKSSLYKNKSAAIAIAIDQLQKSGKLIEGTHDLTERGDLREVAVMARLGKRTAQSYIDRFENI